MIQLLLPVLFTLINSAFLKPLIIQRCTQPSYKQPTTELAYNRDLPYPICAPHNHLNQTQRQMIQQCKIQLVVQSLHLVKSDLLISASYTSVYRNQFDRVRSQVVLHKVKPVIHGYQFQKQISLIEFHQSVKLTCYSIYDALRYYKLENIHYTSKFPLSMKDQIIGVERVLQNPQKGQKWNNKKIRWSIVHNFQNQTKPYDIQLQMVMVSSKRIVKVNQQVKDVQMCSFGYQALFDISKQLTGHIKQQSLSFQIFINGDSFTKLQQSHQKYQPPKLEINEKDPFQFSNQLKKTSQDQIKILPGIKQTKQCFVNKTGNKYISHHPFSATSTNEAEVEKSSKLIKSMQYQNGFKKQEINLKHKQSSFQTKQDRNSTQNTLKNSHNQLIRILMEQKRRKKVEKTMQQRQN